MEDYLFIGHSHLICMQRAHIQFRNDFPDAKFINLTEDKYCINSKMIYRKENLNSEIIDGLASYNNVFLMISGNEHNIISFEAHNSGKNLIEAANDLENVLEFCDLQIRLLYEYAFGRVICIMPPPPVPTELINLNSLPEKLKNFVLNKGFPNEEMRIKLWQFQCKYISNLMKKLEGNEFSLYDYNSNNLLNIDQGEMDGTHANLSYGRSLLNKIWNYHEKKSL